MSSTIAQEFSGQGYGFCIRYLSLGAGQASGDLSPTEAAGILSSGLALMAVQHVDEPGWSPSQSLGQTYGNNAAGNAAQVGFPAGVNLWCDLEGVAGGVAASDVIDYCNAWFNAVSSAGYVPGLYVGANAVLTGQQLYSDLLFQHYWQSCSDVPEVSCRGYQMTQSFVSDPVNGIYIDEDTTQTDNEGGRVLWLVKAR
ncbi:DUF1906 domain-containing protein [Paraburkholderia humisilvae]|uniref:DUF1906 domain-containing protein n=1 Tax=Paraburkholderia humisilvae TaxID=627669 RepID=UPI001C2EDA57|nr:DUF1906 domain-containing protein [Paraburkholderia humisilvae]